MQSGYTSSEIMAMQNDAMRRVQEMQRMSKERVSHQPQVNKPQQSAPHHTKPQQNTPQHNIPQENRPYIHPVDIEQVINKPPADNGFTGILERLNLDEEKILIILLAIILINEGADIMMILALGYILLA